MLWYYWLIIVFGILLVLILGRLFFNGPSCSETRDMKGKFIIFTGASSGIGKEASFDLLKKGAEVIFACRDEKKTLDVINEIQNIEIKSRAKFMKIDLTDFDSITSFVKELNQIYPNRKVDILVNNAGLIQHNFKKTKNKIETTLQANLIGSILLTNLLIDKMENNSRIINVSSIAHRNPNVDFDFIENDMNFDKLEQSYRHFYVYALSKLGQIFFTRNFMNYCKENKLNIKNVCLHPGVVYTSLFDGYNSNFCLCIIFYMILPIFWYFTKTPWMGAQTTLQLCYESYENLKDGGYYDNCGLTDSSGESNDMIKAVRFMKYCANLVNLNSREDNELNNLNYLKYLREHEKF